MTLFLSLLRTKFSTPSSIPLQAESGDQADSAARGSHQNLDGDSENSEERRKPQPPPLLKKVSQYTSNLYCNTPPICIGVLPVPPRSEEREYCQYSSHLYRSTPPIRIAVLLGKSWWLRSPGCSPRVTWSALRMTRVI